MVWHEAVIGSGDVQRNDLVILAGLVLAPGAALLAMSLGLNDDAAATAGVTLLCLLWWILEPVPIPVTSLIPLGAFPLLGVLDHREIASAFGSQLVLLMLGGFLLSKGMEHTGAHRRIALLMVRVCGGDDPRRLVLGFMAAAAILSMWISNTATALMLLPVALAVLESSDQQRLAVPLLLGVAYSASIGGIGTPIGTPPNLVFMEVYSVETGAEISFTRWMSWAVPVVLIMVPLAWLWLTRHLSRQGGVSIPPMGAWSSAQKRVLVVFLFTALAWMTRGEPFGGWSSWFDMPQANDASVALLAVVVLFVVPGGEPDGRRLLDWETAKTIPWGVLLLFAGGISIARAFSASGLSGELAQAISGLSSLPTVLIIGLVALSVSFLTETTSNTASTTLLMPVLAAAAVGAGLDPLLLMVPAAMSASCAFMLPVATAPNSIIYGSGLVSTRVMAREGLALNFLGALVITCVCLFQFG
jgi:sodium-dependent dicarboxylate transporter 2/3/5